MRKITFLFLTTCLILTQLTVGYTQDADIDTLRASDVNADGVVNIFDVTLVAANFGTTPTADQTPNPDVNGDGTVNIFDLTRVASHLGKTVRPPAAFVSAVPTANAKLTVDDIIALTFDNTPENVTASTGVVTVTDKTVEITGPFDPGRLTLTVTWTDGTQTLEYTIRTPAAFVSAAPTANATLAVDDTITLTFDSPPEDVKVSPGNATTAGNTVTITGPFQPGSLTLTIIWKDGVQTLPYTVRVPDTEPPKITSGSVTDGDKDVDPEVINGSRHIQVVFSEAVTGNIALQTAAGIDVGWLGKIAGKQGTLTLVKGKELGNAITYVIAGTVKDAAGNATDISLTFTTARRIDIPIPVNDANFESIVLKSEKPIVVEFWAVW